MCAFVFQEHQGKALSDPWGWSGEVVWTEKHGVHDWWGLQSKGRGRVSPVPALAGLQIVIHFIIPLPSLTLYISAHTLPPLLSHSLRPLSSSHLPFLSRTLPLKGSSWSFLQHGGQHLLVGPWGFGPGLVWLLLPVRHLQRWYCSTGAGHRGSTLCWLANHRGAVDCIKFHVKI